MLKIITILSLLASPALAQSATEQAISQKLLQEIGANISCGAKVIDLEKRIKELEEKKNDK